MRHTRMRHKIELSTLRIAENGTGRFQANFINVMFTVINAQQGMLQNGIIDPI